jgi:hypothetical protein
MSEMMSRLNGAIDLLADRASSREKRLFVDDELPALLSELRTELNWLNRVADDRARTEARWSHVVDSPPVRIGAAKSQTSALGASRGQISW